MQLVHSSDSEPGFTRRGRGRGFSYYDTDGTLITNRKERKRIDALAIPPAYKSVWICPLTSGHIQATGIDTKGRKQYRYHPDWTRYQNQTKFSKLLQFGNDLPTIRRQVIRDLDDDTVSRPRMVASAIRLMDHTGARIGNEQYTKLNGSHGVTTLREDHLQTLNSRISTLQLSYSGKGGKDIEFTITSPSLTKSILDAGELPGKRLFRYKDSKGTVRAVSSEDVNEYLSEFGEGYTAKMFRTWKASILAFSEFSQITPEESAEARNRQVTATITKVAAQLYHRPATCRKYYIHPEIVSAFERSQFPQIKPKRPRRAPPKSRLSVTEERFLEFLS